MLVSHEVHGKKSGWKKSSTYFHILGRVVYAMSIRQIRQKHKEKQKEHNKNVAMSSADVAALKWCDPIYDATQNMSQSGTYLLMFVWFLFQKSFLNYIVLLLYFKSTLLYISTIL